MREKYILTALYKAEAEIHQQVLSEELKITERTLRTIIKQLNASGNKSGFTIKQRRGKGYYLEIINEEKLLEYLDAKKIAFDPDNVAQRMEYIQMILFQENEYITIDEIAHKLEVSRTTIQNDLKDIEQQLSTFNLSLDRRQYHGIKIVGNEVDYRKAISKILLTNKQEIIETDEYRIFKKALDIQEMEKILAEQIVIHDVEISQLAFANLLQHIKILAFRASKNNYVKNLEFSLKEIEGVDVANLPKISEHIINHLRTTYQLSIPQSEVEYFTGHLYGKVYIAMHDSAAKDKLLFNINTILSELDMQFLTAFAGDQELLELLSSHILPLQRRLYFNLQLDNPIIDDIYSRYANVFNIALHFVTELNEINSFEITKDEIGYIAVYLAASLEKQERSILNNFRKVLIIAPTRGAAFLLKMKLEDMLKNAKFDTMMYSNGLQLAELSEQYDLILTTEQLANEEEATCIVIKTSPFIEEKDRVDLEQKLSHEYLRLRNMKEEILQLFQAEQFYFVTKEMDYLQHITACAEKLVLTGSANASFPDDVLTRELQMTTIYGNGIAGPHAIEMGALKDSISVTICKKSMDYEDKEVHIIFLINLKKGHLHMHTEISKLMLKIMKNTQLKQSMMQCQNFQEFRAIVKENI